MEGRWSSPNNICGKIEAVRQGDVRKQSVWSTNSSVANFYAPKNVHRKKTPPPPNLHILSKFFSWNNHPSQVVWWEIGKGSTSEEDQLITAESSMLWGEEINRIVTLICRTEVHFMSILPSYLFGVSESPMLWGEQIKRMCYIELQNRECTSWAFCRHICWWYMV